MSRPDENPTAGEMFEEILDLVAGLGVLLLPISLLAIPGLVLLLPLALLAIPFALLAAPFLLIHAVRRRLRGPREDAGQIGSASSAGRSVPVLRTAGHYGSPNR